MNEAVAENPSLVNSDPFGNGWLVKIRSDDTSPLEALLDRSSYDQAYPV